LANADQGDAGQRSEIAAGAERSLLGDAGQNPAVVHGDVFLEILERDGRGAAAQRVDAREHGGPYVRVVEILTDIRLNTAQDIILYVFRERGRHQPVDEAADAGGDAIDDATLGDEGVQQRARGGDALADLVGDLDLDLGVARRFGDRIDGEVDAVWNHGTILVIVGFVRFQHVISRAR